MATLTVTNNTVKLTGPYTSEQRKQLRRWIGEDGIYEVHHANAHEAFQDADAIRARGGLPALPPHLKEAATAYRNTYKLSLLQAAKELATKHEAIVLVASDGGYGAGLTKVSGFQPASRDNTPAHIVTDLPITATNDDCAAWLYQAAPEHINPNALKAGRPFTYNPPGEKIIIAEKSKVMGPQQWFDWNIEEYWVIGRPTEVR